MTAYESWTCDWHADPPEEDGHFVNEDTARDEGWIVIERKVEIDVGGRPWKTTEVKHICADCLKDADCREWLRDGSFTGYFEEDRAALAEAVASEGKES